MIWIFSLTCSFVLYMYCIAYKTSKNFHQILTFMQYYTIYRIRSRSRIQIQISGKGCVMEFIAYLLNTDLDLR